MIINSIDDAFRAYEDKCGGEYPARTRDELRALIHAIGLGYEQIDNRFWDAVFNSNWAWDENVDARKVAVAYGPGAKIRTTKFYAAYRPYGLAALNTNGPRADKLLAFTTRDERDAWVDRDPEHREEMRATSNEIRAALRFEQRMGYSVFSTADTF